MLDFGYDLFSFLPNQHQILKLAVSGSVAEMDRMEREEREDSGEGDQTLPVITR